MRKKKRPVTNPSPDGTNKLPKCSRALAMPRHRTVDLDSETGNKTKQVFPLYSLEHLAATFNFV
jgi:hypothetical protein